MADHNEVVFESEICAHLESHGWLYSANDAGYDRYTLIEYAKAFPPEQGEAFLRQYKAVWTTLATT